ncbi:MAG: efflux RND transporter periplasmic adaptor subunit [Schwartzia sp. (in: firmicutes)]
MNRKAAAFLLVALVSLGGWLFYQARERAAAERAARELTLYGNVDVREITLAFRGSDRIAELTAEEGDAVKKGQRLGRLEDAELRLFLAKTKAQVEAQRAAVDMLHHGSRPEDIAVAEGALLAAEARAAFTADVARRRQAIYDEVGGVSRQELDSARTQADEADGALQRARETYEKAVAGPRAEEVTAGEAQLAALQSEAARQEYLLAQTELIAPADGVIRTRLREVGDMASPAIPVYTLSLLDKKWVRVYVGEAALGRIKEGQSARLYIDSFPDQPIDGQVGYISSTAEFTPKTVQTEELRTALVYEVRVYAADPDNRLRMGMPVTVKVAL